MEEVDDEVNMLEKKLRKCHHRCIAYNAIAKICDEKVTTSQTTT